MSLEIMDTFLRTQALSIASTTLQIAGKTLNYLSGDVNANNLSQNVATYSLAEVRKHDTRTDCWVVIFDKVFDLSEFMNEHPGGYDVLSENAGCDATLAFRSVGHSEDALNIMEKYCIGLLVENERLYTRIRKKSTLDYIIPY